MLSKTLICFLILFTSLGLGYRGAHGDDAFGIELDKRKQMVDCVTGPWDCTECDKHTGLQMCKREIMTQPMHYGRPCGALREKRFCRVNCEMTNWGDWKPCTKTCGGGERSRLRHIHIHPRNGGTECGNVYQFEACNTQGCDVDCKQSEFSCEPCNKYTGKQKCTRKVLIAQAFNGKPCGPAEEERDCKVDCEVTPYGAYGECSKKCGGGYQYKTRTVVHAALNGGHKCPALKYEKLCNPHKCPVDCKHSEWQCHGCDKRTGDEICTRSVIVTPVGKGKPCGDNLKNKKCIVDCEVDYWRPWTTCTKKCGTGTQTRYRKIVFKALYNGKECPALTETRTCNTKPCPVDCKQSEWEYGVCDYKTGFLTGTRKVLIPAAHHGRECGLNEITKPCKVDCKVTDYLPWSDCTKKCGGGFKWRLRSITYYPKNGGALCPALKEMVPCNEKPCAVDCEQSEWRCGDCDYYKGERQCTRRVLVQPLHHGKKCEGNEKTEKCQVDCKVSEWTPYSECSKKCGGGFQKRTRQVIYGAKNHGLECPKLEHVIACNSHKCSVDCQQGPFKCDPCDPKTGEQSCKRDTLVYPQGHGQACGPSKKTKYCDVDCVVGPFGEFSACSKQCGKGTKQRERKVTIYQRGGGAGCPALIEKVACNLHECDRDCQQEENCGNCDLYTGKQACRRKVIVTPKGKGAKCLPHEFEKDCVVDCKLAPWGVYSPCSKTCGGGVQTRVRKIGHIARNGGKPCLGLLKEERKCNENPCEAPKCEKCPEVHCGKGEMKKYYKGVPCPCPYCEKWVWTDSLTSSTSMVGVAGFAVGGIALMAIYNIMKRKEEKSYERLLNSVDAETEELL